MTNKGILIPIDRNGMKMTEVGPLGKCSFEEADQQLYKAAVAGDTDDVTGVSANIIFGQAPPCGTGTVNVSLDEDHYHQLVCESITDQNTDQNNEEVTFDFND
jgi:DNA-directed RNA polymerase II subunit RPB1